MASEASSGESTVTFKKLPVDPAASFRQEKADEVCYIRRSPKSGSVANCRSVLRIDAKQLVEESDFSSYARLEKDAL